MLIIMLHNVKMAADDEPNSEYNVNVLVNKRMIAIGHVAGHRRSDGWRALLKKFLDEGGGEDLE